jgi:hypothetical protein
MKDSLKAHLSKSVRLGSLKLKKLMFDEIRAQGHKASGDLEQSSFITYEHNADGWVATIYAKEYITTLHTGILPSRVPFYPNSGNTTSQYILGLVKWLNDINVSGDALSIAFRIAYSAVTKTRGGLGEGHPTRGAINFSSNGRRTGWINQMQNNSISFLIEREMLFDEYATLLEQRFTFHNVYSINIAL